MTTELDFTLTDMLAYQELRRRLEALADAVLIDYRKVHPHLRYHEVRDVIVEDGNFHVTTATHSRGHTDYDGFMVPVAVVVLPRDQRAQAILMEHALEEAAYSQVRFERVMENW